MTDRARPFAPIADAIAAIGRGENARRTLAEFNIVRSFVRVGRWDGTPRRMTVPLASIPPDATAVVALLQRPNQGAIAGAGRLALR